MGYVPFPLDLSSSEVSYYSDTSDIIAMKGTASVASDEM